ncbi:MAG: glutathione S-transferase [Mariprofundaceae bacterium]|nr:glutathione S-transferase [Mariprofundaceae bacterium]
MPLWKPEEVQTMLCQSSKVKPITPILYSFRRCPYAMRARMAIAQSGVIVEHREVLLRQKPKELLEASAKGTVPVLVLGNSQVIDESWQIMHWALAQNDPDDWRHQAHHEPIEALIKDNDHDFKTHLDHYKYAVRHPEQRMEVYRQAGEIFLQNLEARLQQQPYLINHSVSMADIAIMPFVRQFAHVDKAWFEQANYPQLRQWLNHFLESELFKTVMQKHVLWEG